MGDNMPDLKEKKCLIAYFSRAGNNYVGGQIVNLEVGNTKIAAEIIQEIIGGDLFQIDTVTPYPKDYSATTNVAKKELNENARPKLTSHVTNMDSYDTIFLGYPNWLGTVPMAVFTFLEEYDFSEKSIIQFCTHEGSGMGHSERDIQKSCPDAKILNGLSIYGSQVNSSKKDIENWLDKLNML